MLWELLALCQGARPYSYNFQPRGGNKVPALLLQSGNTSAYLPYSR